MTQPPQQRPNPALISDQQERAFRMKLAGLSHDRIAAELGVSHGTVANRLKAAIADHVAPAAEDYVAFREAELADLYTHAYRAVISPNSDVDERLKAIDTCRRLNESRRKLRGADAPVSMAVTAEARIDASADLIASVLGVVLSGVVDAAGLDGPDRNALYAYGSELAQRELLVSSGDTDTPVPAVPRLSRDRRDTVPQEGTAGGDSRDSVPSGPFRLTADDIAEAWELINHVPELDEDDDDEEIA